MGPSAIRKVAPNQEPNKSLTTANKQLMETTQTLQLFMPKWPEAARKSFLVMNTTNNLVAISELADADCGIYFHRTGVEID